MIQMIIVEDEPAIARGLSLMITRNYPDFQVIAIARNGKEGLQKILDMKPELVFVDINMPIMNGLEMIEQVQKSGFSTQFIILTGYAEFEYARTAMRLGISDYLLKPISPDTLKEILTSCRQKHQAQLHVLQAAYLQRYIGRTQNPDDSNNPLFGYNCTLFVLISGPLCSNIYNEALLTSHAPSVDLTLIRTLENDYHISLFPLRGRHDNELIFAAVHPKPESADLGKLAEELYTSFRSPDTYVNLIISEPIPDGLNLRETAGNLYLYAMLKIPFAFGCIQNYEPLSDKKIHVSSEVKKICSAIPEHTTPETVQDYIRSILLYWQKERVSQFQLTTDLRYFFSTVIHEYSEENIIYPDAAEIVSSCHFYDELERSLQYEMGLIYGPDSYDLPDSQQSLAKQVKNWLDMNFTTPITFKIFQDIFGHSEKYISALFKAEFGISPSKYIGELRLDMAKKLMQTNPDILLKDVAEMVGYTDAFYFSRVFKSHEGISPSQYAKLVKEKNF